MRRAIPYHITFTGPPFALATLLSYLPSRTGAAAVRACSQIQVLRQTSVDVKCVLPLPINAERADPLTDPMCDIASTGTRMCHLERRQRCGVFGVSGRARSTELYVKPDDAISSHIPPCFFRCFLHFLSVVGLSFRRGRGLTHSFLSRS
jgi:hypothetical protein